MMDERPNLPKQPRSKHWIGVTAPEATKLSQNNRRRSRSYGRAKTLDEKEVEAVRNYIRQHSSRVESDELKFLLSVRAGLRAAEIAELEMSALITPDGRIGKSIELHAEWTKSNRQRSIPMHPDVIDAVKRFRRRYPDANCVAVSDRVTGGQLSANAVTVWFHQLYANVGFKGCSSHSGRRTFITALARRANEFNRSLKDVQRLAGHCRLDTTESYIELADDLHDLIKSL